MFKTITKFKRMLPCAIAFVLIIAITGCGSISHNSLGVSLVPTVATKAKLRATFFGGTTASSSSSGTKNVVRRVARSINTDQYLPSGKVKRYLNSKAESVRFANLPKGQRTARSSRALGDDPNLSFDGTAMAFAYLVAEPGKNTYYYYLDEAKTMPAGSRVDTFNVVDSFPFYNTTTINVTAGPNAGTTYSYDALRNADESGHVIFSDNPTDGNTGFGTETFDALGNKVYNSHTQDPTGYFQDRSGTINSDNSGTSHYASATTYTADYVYNTDTSGHATISGTDPGLPATISWTPSGTTTVTYADGSTETYNDWGVPTAGSAY